MSPKKLKHKKTVASATVFLYSSVNYLQNLSHYLLIIRSVFN
jgi:hypothetical protein